ncbi:MAG: class I SAM-dependent methyltransferase [Planctomycetota bacterium]|jgi:tRNA (cmo5U34)-methyltransferase
MGNPWLDESHARAWRAEAKPGNPLRQEQVDVMLRLAVAVQPRRLLDLGSGTGEVTRLLLERLHSVHVTCLDASPAMHERARGVLADLTTRCTFVEARMEDDWRADVDGPFDLAIGIQSVHHLEPEEKRRLFSRVHAVVRDGGAFLLNDRVAIHERFFPAYVALWNAARTRQEFDELPSALTHDDYLRELTRNGDLPDPVEDQLSWLRSAGFEPVECFWRHANRAVFGGIRAR